MSSPYQRHEPEPSENVDDLILHDGDSDEHSERTKSQPHNRTSDIG